MNKDHLNNLYLKYKPTLLKLLTVIQYIGLFLLFTGLGATYQANHDVNALNLTLANCVSQNCLLTDGVSYYFVGLYNNKINFSSDDLLNRSQCNEYYGIGR